MENRDRVRVAGLLGSTRGVAAKQVTAARVGDSRQHTRETAKTTSGMHRGCEQFTVSPGVNALVCGEHFWWSPRLCNDFRRTVMAPLVGVSGLVCHRGCVVRGRQVGSYIQKFSCR